MTTLFLHFFLLLITHLIPAVHSHCIEDQQLSLLHFKKSLVFHSSDSSMLITWNSSTDCCSWLGVTCSTNGHVVGLDLSSEYMSCNIDNSSSLFQLQHLQSLNLAYNNFNRSPIPSAIGKLTNLRYLNLSRAYFVGEIPIEISRLTRLAILDLSIYDRYWYVEEDNTKLNMRFQNLTGLTELNLNGVNLSAQGPHWCRAISSSMLNLSVLSLSSCGLSGPICESLAKLQSLTEIYLAQNYLQGTFPKEVFQIPCLQTIDLSMNHELGGSFPEFPKNGSLQSVVLWDTTFSGILPNSIGNLKMLSKLELIGCSFTGSVPKSIANLTQLANLDMSVNMFNGPISAIHWESLVNLESLRLGDNQLNGSIPSSIFSLPLLEKLALSYNLFSGQVPEISNTSSPLLSELDLGNNNLEGQIPTSIFNLQGLQYLYLSSNNFTGFPFNGPQQPRNLSSLDVSHNSLLFDYNGSNSSFLQIKTLVLASNKLRAFPDFLKNQSILSELDLSNNQIQGQIPNWIWSLNSFQRLELNPFRRLDLNLSCNSLETLEAPLLNSTSFLSSLDLHSNKLQGQIPMFVSATYLDYSRNNFSSSIPTDIGEVISAAAYLSLSSNSLHGAIPKSICNASGRVLDLSNNSLSGIIPQCLTQVESLLVLDLSRNNLLGTIPDNFLEDCKLYTLDLNINQIQGQFPKSLVNCSNLEVLNLGNNQITDTFPCLLMSISTLRALDLRRNNLTGTLPDSFLEDCKLHTLDLSINQIQGQFPKSLVNCSNLEVLNLGNNQITDTFPCLLMSISTLHVLVLRFNKFYGSIGCPKTNDTWPVLQIIDLAHNNLSGEIPGRMSLTWQAMVANEDDSSTNLGFSSHPFLSFDDGDRPQPHVYYRDAITTIIKGLELDLVKILTIFTLIDFSSNNFNGSIPEEMGQLKSLYVLNLSGNALTGKIPSSFGNMRQLESLDLSNNNLSGQIPPQFANLTFLSFLNVSNNQLTGKIPTSTQFSTFLNTSFEGNKGLWGPPLTADIVAPLPPPMLNGSLSNPNYGDEIDWDIISVEIGFTCGFGIAVGSLLFCKRWRKWYYRAMCNILFKTFPQLEQRFGNHTRHAYVNTRWSH